MFIYPLTRIQQVEDSPPGTAYGYMGKDGNAKIEVYPVFTHPVFEELGDDGYLEAGIGGRDPYRFVEVSAPGWGGPRVCTRIGFIRDALKRSDERYQDIKRYERLNSWTVDSLGVNFKVSIGRGTDFDWGQLSEPEKKEGKGQDYIQATWPLMVEHGAETANFTLRLYGNRFISIPEVSKSGSFSKKGPSEDIAVCLAPLANQIREGKSLKDGLLFLEVNNG